jgi:hypothetical protein
MTLKCSAHTRFAYSRFAALLAAMMAAVAASPSAYAQQVLKSGDVLSGELNAMRSRVNGKRVSTYQIVSQPRRLAGSGGLCNLETGPETFQLVTNGDADAAKLKKLVGKTVSVKVDDMACAEAAGQMSDAIVTKWSVVTPH